MKGDSAGQLSVDHRLDRLEKLFSSLSSFEVAELARHPKSHTLKMSDKNFRNQSFFYSSKLFQKVFFKSCSCPCKALEKNFDKMKHMSNKRRAKIKLLERKLKLAAVATTLTI
jgi:hypothetical protein